MTSMELRPHKQPEVLVDDPASGYPEDPAVTVLEKVLEKLSQQAIKHEDLADADAAIVQAFFASLKFATRKDPINPIGPSNIMLTPEERSRVKWNLRLAFAYPEDDQLVACGEAFANRVLDMGIPALSREKLRVPLAHLAIRYTLLEREDSDLRLARVYFPGCSEASLGVVAAQDIPNATFILRSATNAASSAKHNFSSQKVLARVDDGMKISLMTPSAVMLGPKVVRIMLGPLRFVNHACKPNCMFVCVKKTHSIILWTLREIKKGEAVTVLYHESWQKYAPGVPCGCATCVPLESSSGAHSNNDDGNEDDAMRGNEGTEGRTRKRPSRKRGGAAKKARRARWVEEQKENESDDMEE